MRDESRFLNVGGLDEYLKVRHREIEQRKESRAGECVETIFETRQRETQTS